jgi:ribosomal protein S18 acetylase RimI-like enzyme
MTPVLQSLPSEIRVFYRATYGIHLWTAKNLKIEVGQAEAYIPHGENAFFVEGLSIYDGHRSQGIGSAMFANILATLQGYGRPVYLLVARTNTGAQRFYERFGGQRADAICSRDMLEYWWPVPQAVLQKAG